MKCNEVLPPLGLGSRITQEIEIGMKEPSTDVSVMKFMEPEQAGSLLIRLLTLS